MRDGSVEISKPGTSGTPGTLGTLGTLRVERLLDVVHDVLPRLAADAEADESVADGVAAPPGPALGHRVHAAEARGFADQRERAQERLRAGARAKVEAQDAAKPAHLRL